MNSKIVQKSGVKKSYTLAKSSSLFSTASWTSGYIFNGSTVYFDVVIPEDGKLTLTGNNLVAGGNNVTLAGHRSLTMSGVGMGSMGTATSPASVLPVIVLGQEETVTSRPQLTGEDTVITSMRLG
ncbi:MAG: hypothetical protein IJ975_02590, partial [Clostridia bacterium]|nr:hypothetical protein [Clostridia bacterium]